MSISQARGSGITGGKFKDSLVARDFGGGFKAAGGNITEDDGYVIHTFTGSDEFVVSYGQRDIEYLVVGGGGGGGGTNQGNRGAGGGGAGGFRTGTLSSPITKGSYTVTVGAGGNGFNSQVASDNGSLSQFSNFSQS